MNHQRVKYLKLLQQKVAKSSSDENTSQLDLNESDEANGFMDYAESSAHREVLTSQMVEKPQQTLKGSIKALELSDSSSASNGVGTSSPKEDHNQHVAMDISSDSNIVTDPVEENLVEISDHDSDDSEWEERMISAQKMKESGANNKAAEATASSSIKVKSENFNTSTNSEEAMKNSLNNKSSIERTAESRKSAHKVEPVKRADTDISSSSRIKIKRENAAKSETSEKPDVTNPLIKENTTSTVQTAPTSESSMDVAEDLKKEEEEEEEEVMPMNVKSRKSSLFHDNEDSFLNTSTRRKKKRSFSNSRSLLDTGRTNLYNRNYFTLRLASAIPFNLRPPHSQSPEIVNIDDKESPSSEKKSLVTPVTTASSKPDAPPTKATSSAAMNTERSNNPLPSSTDPREPSLKAGPPSQTVTTSSSSVSSSKPPESRENTRSALVSSSSSSRDISHTSTAAVNGDHRELADWPPFDKYDSYGPQNSRDRQSDREHKRDRSRSRERSRERSGHGNRRDSNDYFGPSSSERDRSSDRNSRNSYERAGDDRYRRSSSHESREHRTSSSSQYPDNSRRSTSSFSGENYQRSSSHSSENNGTSRGGATSNSHTTTRPSESSSQKRSTNSNTHISTSVEHNLLLDREIAEKYQKEKKEQLINDLLGTPDDEEEGDEPEETNKMDVAPAGESSTVVIPTAAPSSSSVLRPLPIVAPESAVLPRLPSAATPSSSQILPSVTPTPRNQSSTVFILSDTEVAIRYPVSSNGFAFSTTAATIQSESTVRQLQLSRSEVEKLLKQPRPFFKYGKGLLVMLKKREGEMMREIYLLEEVISRVEGDLITGRPRAMEKIVLRQLKKSPNDHRSSVVEVSLNDIDEERIDAYEHIHFTQHLTEEARALLNISYINDHLHYAQVLRNSFHR